MRITILGSGTSTGIPVIGCTCATCASTAPENNRLRASIYIEHPSVKFMVDCSLDFRQQALRHRIPRIDAVILTHDHADHIGGFDDLRGYNFLQRGPIDIYGAPDVLKTVRERYAYCFRPALQIGGGLPQLNLIEIEPGKAFQLGDLEILPVPIKHGLLDIVGYRIGKTFAYLTDCSYVPETSVPMVDSIENLIVGALRPTPHETHFSLPEALEFSRSIRAGKTWFTHITDHLEYFATNAELPSDAQLVYDGQVIEVETC